MSAAKLEPTEALRKAMHDALDDAIDQLMTLVGVGVDIPEGPPVGTIARRPDGAVIALRGGVCDERFWIYKWLDDDPNVPTVKDTNDADSWPQIRPDQWPDQAGLDWLPPGEEPLVPRPDPGSKDAGDWIKAQVVHSGGSLWRRDGYMWRGVGHTGGRSPLPSLARPGVAVTVVIDDDGELVSDLSKLACIDGDVEELLAEHGLLPDPTAQQEPEEPGPPSNAHIKFPKAPRTPRVVDCLGVDEQGTPWRSRSGYEWRHLDGKWQFKSYVLDQWIADAEPALCGPFTEILESQP
ncbi:hypothetical protein B5566_02535 [Mycobacterium sp. MHSD3]|nr:hypothetical protein B5566_02535 [Mycobacterium sp. MHSD3]